MKAVISGFILFIVVGRYVSSGTGTPITWTDHLTGDFSFAKKKSIECNAWCYEWAGTDAVSAAFKTRDTVICTTGMNEATHCSLQLIITKDSCIPSINLLSITPKGNKIYPCKSGYIKIDKTLWNKKILKAEFSFDFINDENSKRVFWNGKLYTKIKPLL